MQLKCTRCRRPILPGDLIVIVTVCLYWGRVGSMVMRARRRSHDLAGLVPEQPRERLMWLIWVPMVAAWLALPIVAITHASPPLGVPAFARTEPYAWSEQRASLAKLMSSWSMVMRPSAIADWASSVPCATVSTTRG